MTTFNNGPARGKVLRLKRAPFFLRVTEEPAPGELLTKIDALDFLGDEPTKHESLYAYRLTAIPGHCHIRASHGQGGFFPLADYTLVDPQPTDAQMRDRDQWVAWVEANKAMADFLKREEAP